MRHMTVTDLLDDPKSPEARAALDALADVLSSRLQVYGHDVLPRGPTRTHKVWQEVRAQARESFLAEHSLWKIGSESYAKRCDGIEITSGRSSSKILTTPDRGALDGRPFTVTFPIYDGRPPPEALVLASTLADAISLTDRRWPCPAWWADPLEGQ